jgi:hypothetical protein
MLPDIPEDAEGKYAEAFYRHWSQSVGRKERKGVIQYRTLPRRRFVLNWLALAAFESLPGRFLRTEAPAFKALPTWKPGILEIHHIATNRGNSALLILPDGTTMMVDAGAIYGTTPYLSDPLPSNQRRPGEWIGRYAKRRLDLSGLTTIDTFLLTHLHGDHVGYLPPDDPSSSGDKVLDDCVHAFTIERGGSWIVRGERISCWANRLPATFGDADRLQKHFPWFSHACFSTSVGELDSWDGPLRFHEGK